MTQGRLKVLANLTTRQKMTAIILVLVVLFLLWQVVGLFGGGAAPTPPPTPQQIAQAPGAPPPMAPQTPQPAQLMAKGAPPSSRESELLKQQQETEAKYIAALNELQMLKVAREIAETNKAIMTAKLDTVTAQKGILDLLTQPAPPPVSQASYAQGLVTPTSMGIPVAQPPTAQPPQTTPQQEVSYVVISVSQLRYKWSAVLGYQGKLFNVAVGDILPPDGSRVASINRAGVVLEKDGEKTKVSLVPVI